MYDDNTNSFIVDVREIESTLEWFQLYARASGAKLNANKCNGQWIGAWRNRADQPFGFSWSNALKINGVYFGVNSVFHNSSMLKQKVDKMCDAYRSRHLTLRGRACIANVVIMCTTMVCRCRHHTARHNIITEINRKIYAFIWNGRFEAVKRRTLNAHPKQGGLGLVNISTKIESLRCAHLFKFVTAVSYTHLTLPTIYSV